MKNFIDKINNEDAYFILKRLIESDEKIAQKAELIADDYFCEVDNEQIANNIFIELDYLEVEELWDSSGSTRYGYIEPHERAYEMVEECIEDYIDEMEKFHKLSKFKACREYCIGILKGLMKYKKEATNEFKDWAVDVPNNFSTRFGKNGRICRKMKRK